MAAGIMEFDTGFIFGTTWHNHPRYIRQDFPVTIEQVKEVFDWEIDKRPAYFVNNNSEMVPNGTYTLVRKDTGHILVESVGSKFVAESNLKMAEIVESGVLKQFPDLIIEGCGSLWNNRTSFIQLKAKEFQIKGDKSPSFTRMIYCNPLGNGAYKALVHNERVVCANTLRVAEAEGDANKSLKKFSHLDGAYTKLNTYMEELAEQWLLLDRHIEILNSFATQSINEEGIKLFLNKVYPQTSDMSDVAISHNVQKRLAVYNQFNKDQDLTADVAFSKYGLLQALTYVIDHEDLRKGPIKTNWDNWAGTRMDLKATGFNYLMAA